jgi:hypothetical protein
MIDDIFAVVTRDADGAVATCARFTTPEDAEKAARKLVGKGRNMVVIQRVGGPELACVSMDAEGKIWTDIYAEGTAIL